MYNLEDRNLQIRVAGDIAGYWSWLRTIPEEGGCSYLYFAIIGFVVIVLYVAASPF